ncbi:hypothetical protein RFI_33405, partial [Reticulomyxa filosa]
FFFFFFFFFFFWIGPDRLLLFVFVKSARDLPRTDRGTGNSTCYCVVTVGNDSGRSNAVSLSSPVWNGVFQFRIQYENFVIVDLFSSDVTSDEDIGRVLIHLSEFHRFAEFEWVPLRKFGKSNKTQGDVCVKIAITETPRAAQYGEYSKVMFVCFVSFETIMLQCAIEKKKKKKELVSFCRAMDLNPILLKHEPSVQQRQTSTKNVLSNNELPSLVPPPSSSTQQPDIHLKEKSEE